LESGEPTAHKGYFWGSECALCQRIYTYEGAGRGAPKKANTLHDIDKAARRFADWLDKPVTEITGDMVKARHAEIAARSPAQANQACRYLRAAINHVNADSDEDAPVLARNTVDRLSRVAQWAPVPRATIGLQRDAEIRDALLFMILTGARISEVLGDPKVGYPPLRWDAVDLERGVVVLEATKNRSDHELPLTPFAKGGVVKGATPFPMQGGLGVMGEAGPEAIIPLSRGPDGKLGVTAAKGGDVDLEVVVNNYAGAEVQVDQRGGRAEIAIRNAVSDVIGSGHADRAMRQRFGLRKTARGG
jgi:hypothetical protein